MRDVKKATLLTAGQGTKECDGVNPFWKLCVRTLALGRVLGANRVMTHGTCLRLAMTLHNIQIRNYVGRNNPWKNFYANACYKASASKDFKDDSATVHVPMTTCRYILRSVIHVVSHATEKYTTSCK